MGTPLFSTGLIVSHARVQAGREQDEPQAYCSGDEKATTFLWSITIPSMLEVTTHDGRFSLRSGDILFTEAQPAVTQ